MNRKKSVLLSLLLMLTLLLSACSAPKQEEASTQTDNTIVVGFSQVGAESDWRNANTLSMTQALCEENGFRLIIDDAQQKQERQITAIRNFIQMNVDYIVLAPTTETGWDTVLEECKKAGIPVIIVDRRIQVKDENLFTCWVGSDFLREGELAIQWMTAHFGNQPVKLIHLQGNIGSSAQLGRTQALESALKAHPEWQLVWQGTGDWIEAKGQEIMESLLAESTEFNVIYSENDNMTYGAVTAMKNAGLTPGKDVTLISFDASHTALEMTLAGEISFDAECNPLHGPRVAAIIRQLEKGETPEKYTFVSETCFDSESITKEMIGERSY